MRLGRFALALAVTAFPPATARAQAPAPSLRAAAAMDARLLPPVAAEPTRPPQAAVGGDGYDWGAGFIGMVVGAGAGVAVGYLVRAQADPREESPGLPVALGILGGIIGFFVGLTIGNP